jgi:hypothetical protein
MDALQMAGHLSLEYGAVVEGPWRGPQNGDQVVRVWLPNGRGLSLLWRAETDEIDMITVRETVAERGREGGETPWVTDRTTPVPNGGEKRPLTLDYAREALTVLRGLPKRVDLEVGDRVRLTLPHSEVCAYMRVAGTVMEVEVREHGAQLHKDGRPFAGAITWGEAGIYRDADGPYVYNAERVAAQG